MSGFVNTKSGFITMSNNKEDSGAVMKKWCNLRFTNSLLCGALLVDSTSANCFNSVGAEFLLKVKPIFETIGAPPGPTKDECYTIDEVYWRSEGGYQFKLLTLSNYVYRGYRCLDATQTTSQISTEQFGNFKLVETVRACGRLLITLGP